MNCHGSILAHQMRENGVLFSIVIVNFNYGRFLEEAIRSVLNQSCQDFELIVVDGGSTDNSAEIIQAFSDRLGGVRFGQSAVAVGSGQLAGDGGRETGDGGRETGLLQSAVGSGQSGSGSSNNFRTLERSNFRTRFLWCSEPDEGQSHAFNKGFSKAKGRILTWLNSDDILFPGALARAKKTISEHPDGEWFVGGCFWLNPDLTVIKCSRARSFSTIRANRGEISVWAPSSFFAKALYDRVGGLDCNFHYMMDTELWFRFYRKAGVRYRPIPGYCWGLRLHPDAKMSGHNFAGSAQTLASHPKWTRMQAEGAVFHQRYGHTQVSRTVKWLTTPPTIYLQNQIDSWRFRGKPYSVCFRGRDQDST